MTTLLVIALVAATLGYVLWPVFRPASPPPPRDRDESSPSRAPGP